MSDTRAGDRAAFFREHLLAASLKLVAVSRMRRMEQPDNSESTNKARNARRLDQRPDRL
jgi:hypothetical protein